jgi:Flp pilus assembly protein TadG
MSIQLLVIMVPVLFGLMGFALDLGRLYLIRGELNQAANSMALAAASQLIGTASSLDNAAFAANQSINDANGVANRYNFGSLLLNSTAGNLSSTVNAPSFFAAVGDATSGTGSGADGTTARHAQITLLADAPLLFWSLLPGGETRKTSIAATALAGVSAPLCTACGIEPFAVAAIDATDTDNFGFGDPSAGTVFTFAYTCLGTPLPAALPGAATVLPYAIVNRYDTANPNFDESQQLYRDGAGGLIASQNPNPSGSPVPLACMGINDTLDTVWASAVPNRCAAQVSAGVSTALCGLYSRFDSGGAPDACTTLVTGFADLSTAYTPDVDVTTGVADLYTSYTGSGRRVITVAVVNGLPADTTTPMTVLAFRQFLVEPNQDGTFLNPADPNGRFPAQYIGSPMPLRQGYFDDRFGLSCQVSSGPGKVVLHQ